MYRLQLFEYVLVANICVQVAVICVLVAVICVQVTLDASGRRCNFNEQV